jgi:hypothetical protein
MDRLVANKTSNTEFSKCFARDARAVHMVGHSEHDAGQKRGPVIRPESSARIAIRGSMP